MSIYDGKIEPLPTQKKTLTEQWREGTLPTGSYYIRIITGNEKSDYFEGKKFCFWSDYEVEEVLAPVPSYEKYVELLKKIDELEKKLAIAVKALEFYDTWFDGRLSHRESVAAKALKQIKEVK